ncbi:MAG TPA: DUF3106 domain-containing protein [Thermoanaerobaculia bacterium]|nr:DUF3106 domain-containing protein [Thermoanaerobaculia bacterium]
MTCDEFRERIVDPASAAHGGHAPVVAHLEECAACRSAARDYAALDRLIRPGTPSEPAPDLEARLRQRLTAGPGSARRSVWLLGGAVAVLAVAALAAPRLLRGRSAPSTAIGALPAVPASAKPSAARAVAGEVPPPEIVAVRSTPISFQTPPLTAQEKSEAASLHDFDFLGSFQALARLDAFFPEPVGPRAPVPTAVGGFPSRPPDSSDALTGRFLDWQRTSKKERERLSALERAFRDRPDEERALLEDRWTFVRDFTEDQRSGLRRLASRLDELDARAHERLETEIRVIGRLPRGERAERWRSLSFAKPLTGQELASAERLLLSR